uniref:Uncharacterized protein n=1 Tax=Meloidogyne floridensis TaxID=298350 RepID=A0A915NEA9_9BILA
MSDPGHFSEDDFVLNNDSVDENEFNLPEMPPSGKRRKKKIKKKRKSTKKSGKKKSLKKKSTKGKSTIKKSVKNNSPKIPLRLGEKIRGLDLLEFSDELPTKHIEEHKEKVAEKPSTSVDLDIIMRGQEDLFTRKDQKGTGKV